MSKSCKKYPILIQEKSDKKELNRKVRRLKLEVYLKGSQYKKIVPDHSTWKYRWTLETAINDYKFGVAKHQQHIMTLEDWEEYWRRMCQRK